MRALHSNTDIRTGMENKYDSPLFKCCKYQFYTECRIRVVIMVAKSPMHLKSVWKGRAWSPSCNIEEKIAHLNCLDYITGYTMHVLTRQLLTPNTSYDGARPGTTTMPFLRALHMFQENIHPF